MKIKTILIALIVCGLSGYSFGDDKKPFLFEYDAVHFGVVKFMQQPKDFSILNKDGKVNNEILECIAPIKRTYRLDRLKKILNNKNSFTEGICDCIMCPFVFIFYNKGKIVATLVPNMTGGDLGLSTFNKVEFGWSREGLKNLALFGIDQSFLAYLDTGYERKKKETSNKENSE